MGRRDTPVTGDWDGDDATEVGYYRAANHTFYLRSGRQLPDRRLGGAGDRAVSGDWNGDGRTEIGVFNPATATWKLRVRRTSGYATRRGLSAAPATCR